MGIQRPKLSMITDVTSLQHGYLTPAQSPQEGEITTWLLDCRNLWPGDNIQTAKGAAEALSLVSIPEQNTIKGKLFVQDARMSLASALLKRAYISQTLGMKWKDVRIARKGDPKHGKPCAVDAVGRPIPGIDFNVSHQGGLVALIGWNGQESHCPTPSGMVYGLISPTTKDEVMVGVDIVCVNERDDYRTIDAEGFDGWVDIYEFVFSNEERFSMKYDVDYVTLHDGSVLGNDDIGRHDRCIERDRYISLTTPNGRDVCFPSDCILDAKLRRFYTYFCYKEAYIKLAGEALLAPWLKQLEFFNVRSPLPGTQSRCSELGTWGEEISDVEVHMHKRPVKDVRMSVTAFEEDFMLSTAIQGKIEGLKVPPFKKLDLQADILAFSPLAEQSKTRLTRAMSLHRRIVSDPTQIPARMMTRESFVNSPLVHGKDVPNLGDNPYLYVRELPLSLM